MPILPYEAIEQHRLVTYRLLPELRLHNLDDAIQFVNQRGFVFFWPIKGIDLPSLWAAVAGDRPVADEHDDPGHITWGWKDASLGQRRWYYAKAVRKKSTIISLDLAPAFYALSENYGAPEEDYLTLYEQGRLAQEAKAVYEALLHNGPLDTIDLRRATRMTSRESDSRFNKAITDLQADFKILPVGVSQAGGWHYAFIYEVAARHFPELPDLAQAMGEQEARCQILTSYLRSVGAAPLMTLPRLFGWTPREAQRAVERLAQMEAVTLGVEVEGRPGEWIAVRELC